MRDCFTVHTGVYLCTYLMCALGVMVALTVDVTEYTDTMCATVYDLVVGTSLIIHMSVFTGSAQYIGRNKQFMCAYKSVSSHSIHCQMCLRSGNPS